LVYIRVLRTVRANCSCGVGCRMLGVGCFKVLGWHSIWSGGKVFGEKEKFGLQKSWPALNR
jgi:hypothetical protein